MIDLTREQPLSFTAAAELLRVDPAEIETWFRDGLECIRIGSRLFTTREAIQRFAKPIIAAGKPERPSKSAAAIASASEAESKLSAFDLPATKHPWHRWTNGEVWELQAGVDFDVSITALSSAAYAYARRRGLIARFSAKGNSGRVKLQFMRKADCATDRRRNRHRTKDRAEMTMATAERAVGEEAAALPDTREAPII